MKYELLGTRIGKLVDEKNAAYGDSFAEVGEFMKLLYPDGIAPEQYSDVLCLVRIFDKMKRIATRKGAFGESPYMDIAGYAILGVHKDETPEFFPEESSSDINPTRRPRKRHESAPSWAPPRPTGDATGNSIPENKIKTDPAGLKPKS